MSKINDEGANFLSILKAIPEEEMMRKQAAIRKIGKRIFCLYTILKAIDTMDDNFL